MDKSAHTFQEQVDKVGTNYQKVKPDIQGAKPANLKSRFENMALLSDEETKARAAAQKKLREEKDLKDREQATKSEVEYNPQEPTKDRGQRKSIVTGRNEKISDVINVFNAPAPSDEVKQPAVSLIYCEFPLLHKEFFKNRNNLSNYQKRSNRHLSKQNQTSFRVLKK
jgi:hypothetical protein